MPYPAADHGKGIQWRARWHEGAKQPSKSFRRKVDADRFAAKVQADMDRGLYIDPQGGKTKRQEETLTDLVAAAAGLILGQRGRGAPVAVLRGIAYEHSDEGVAAMLHHTP